MTDRELERLAPRLGEDAGTRLDVDRVADRVTGRLRVAGGAVPVRNVGRWLAVAAGIALMVGAGLFTFGADGAPPVAVAPPVTVPGLHDLSAAELGQVLDSLDMAQAARLVGHTLDDLDAEQLQVLLTMMEG